MAMNTAGKFSGDMGGKGRMMKKKGKAMPMKKIKAKAKKVKADMDVMPDKDFGSR